MLRIIGKKFSHFPFLPLFPNLPSAVNIMSSLRRVCNRESLYSFSFDFLAFCLFPNEVPSKTLIVPSAIFFKGNLKSSTDFLQRDTCLGQERVFSLFFVGVCLKLVTFCKARLSGHHLNLEYETARTSELLLNVEVIC